MKLSELIPTVKATTSKIGGDIQSMISKLENGGPWIESGGGGFRIGPPKKETKASPVAQNQPVNNPVAIAPTATPDPLKGYTRSQVDDNTKNLIVQNAQKYGLNPAVIAGILFQESGINPQVQDNVSVMESGIKSRDRGMAQISDYWNPDVSDEQARDPNFAVDFLAKRIKENFDKKGKLSEAIAGYNVGLSRVGPDPSRPTGIGPKGQKYLSGVAANLDPELVKELGIY